MTATVYANLALFCLKLFISNDNNSKVQAKYFLLLDSHMSRGDPVKGATLHVYLDQGGNVHIYYFCFVCSQWTYAFVINYSSILQYNFRSGDNFWISLFIENF